MVLRSMIEIAYDREGLSSCSCASCPLTSLHLGSLSTTACGSQGHPSRRHGEPTDRELENRGAPMPEDEWSQERISWPSPKARIKEFEAGREFRQREVPSGRPCLLGAMSYWSLARIAHGQTSLSVAPNISRIPGRPQTGLSLAPRELPTGEENSGGASP